MLLRIWAGGKAQPVRRFKLNLEQRICTHELMHVLAAGPPPHTDQNCRHEEDEFDRVEVESPLYSYLYRVHYLLKLILLICTQPYRGSN